MDVSSRALGEEAGAPVSEPSQLIAAQAAPDTGLACLLMMAAFHAIPADPQQLRHEYGQDSLSTTSLLLAAKQLGFTARLIRPLPQRLDKAPLPCIASDAEGRFFIFAKFDKDMEVPSKAGGEGKSSTGPRVLIQRPGEPPSILAMEAFLQLWSGEVIAMTSKANFAGEASRFDFTWFIPAVIKYRRLLGEVLVVSLVLQLVKNAA